MSFVGGRGERRDEAPFTVRHNGLLDTKLLRDSRIVVLGTGGIAGALTDLAGLGIGRFVLIDDDVVSETNVGTADFERADVGTPKVEALAAKIRSVSEWAEVDTFVAKDTDLAGGMLADQVGRATIFLVMVDDAGVHGRANRIALDAETDTLFGGVALDSRSYEIIGTLAGASRCYRCFAHERLNAYENGRQRPGSVASHRLIASRINDAIAWLTVGVIHARAASALPIAQYGHAFIATPMLIGSLDFGKWSKPGEPFGHLEDTDRFSATRFAWAQRDGFKCPDCGQEH